MQICKFANLHPTLCAEFVAYITRLAAIPRN